MRNLRRQGDGLNIVPRQIQPTKTLRERQREYVADVKTRYPLWNAYEQNVRDAIVILEMATSAISFDWDGTLFRTKLVTSMLLDCFRAHESGGYVLSPVQANSDPLALD